MSEAVCDVLIVGAGPAGLAAALELRRGGVGEVIVVDREAEAGGIPRHCRHTGFGIRDLHLLLSGPAYARRYVHLAERAGVHLRMATTVTDWRGPTSVGVTSPAGIDAIHARAIVLATGCRERPRSARLVPGDRPPGVLTTGSLQQLVYLHRQRAGTRALVVGAEHVSFSAVLTLHHGGTRTVAMISEHPAHQTYWPFKLIAAGRLGVPVLTSSRLVRIVGKSRVEAVEVADLNTGTAQTIACDTVVFTGDWIPDHELARRGELAMNDASRAPSVDQALRTSTRGVFAAGNLIHAAETADVAALSGRHAARAALRFLAGEPWPAVPPIPITCAPPLLWVSPSSISAGTTPIPSPPFVLRVRDFQNDTTMEVRQRDRILWRQSYRRLTPNRSIRIPGEWIEAIDGNGGPIGFNLGR